MRTEINSMGKSTDLNGTMKMKSVRYPGKTAHGNIGKNTNRHFNNCITDTDTSLVVTQYALYTPKLQTLSFVFR